ncbi:MAG: hypothetical protein M3229_04775, partial [Actinomycetota bacterium]|nr:hypothetical protein [Actinomycetota bacterium]
TSSFQLPGIVESWPVLCMKLAVRIRPSGRVVHASARLFEPGVFAASHCQTLGSDLERALGADSWGQTSNGALSGPASWGQTSSGGGATCLDVPLPRLTCPHAGNAVGNEKGGG